MCDRRAALACVPSTRCTPSQVAYHARLECALLAAQAAAALGALGEEGARKLPPPPPLPLPSCASRCALPPSCRPPRHARPVRAPSLPRCAPPPAVPPQGSLDGYRQLAAAMVAQSVARAASSMPGSPALLLTLSPHVSLWDVSLAAEYEDILTRLRDRMRAEEEERRRRRRQLKRRLAGTAADDAADASPGEGLGAGAACEAAVSASLYGAALSGALHEGLGGAAASRPASPAPAAAGRPPLSPPSHSRGGSSGAAGPLPGPAASPAAEATQQQQQREEGGGGGLASLGLGPQESASVELFTDPLRAGPPVEAPPTPQGGGGGGGAAARSDAGGDAAEEAAGDGGDGGGVPPAAVEPRRDEGRGDDAAGEGEGEGEEQDLHEGLAESEALARFRAMHGWKVRRTEALRAPAAESKHRRLSCPAQSSATCGRCPLFPALHALRFR